LNVKIKNVMTLIAAYYLTKCRI